MKRVLIISYYWPPAGGSGVQRWLKFTKYLPQFGWAPIVYTPSNPDITLEDRTLSDQIHPMTEIVSTKIIEPYSIFRHFIGGNGSKAATSEKNEVNLINANGKKSLKMRISLWIRANVFIPDPKILWVSPSVKFLCKYLKEHPVDLIVSTGPPHSMHLIAQKVSRRYNIKWVADFRDPWTGIFYFKHLPLTKSSLRRYMKMEEGVLRNADAVVTVTDRIATDLTEAVKSAGAKTPIYNIENGYDESDFCYDEETSPYFTLVHTGLLAAEGDPDRLWKIIGELCREIPSFAEDFRLELVGKTDASVIDGIFNKMKSGSASVSAYYAGDFLSMYEDNEDLAFYYPSEGTNIYVDAMCVPANAEHAELAMEYINFMCSEEIAVANAEYHYYASPNRLVTENAEYVEYMESIHEDAMKILYDDVSTVKSQAYLNLAPDKLTLLNDLWEELKVESSVGKGIIICCAIILAALAAFVVYTILRKRRWAKLY